DQELDADARAQERYAKTEHRSGGDRNPRRTTALLGEEVEGDAEQQCHQHRRRAIAVRQELRRHSNHCGDEESRQQRTEARPDAQPRSENGGERPPRTHSAGCGRMSSLRMPATVTGFFIASRRKGSPSSWFSTTSMKVLTPFSICSRIAVRSVSVNSSMVV